ncbi:hypothetical protein ACPXB3_22410, partial [Gordonia sp. DT219]
MDEVEDMLRRVGMYLARNVVNSGGPLFDGDWDTYMLIKHFSPGHISGTRSAFLGGEYVNDRSIKLSKSARNVIDDYIEEFRINFPVPLWLFDALVLVVDREPVRGVVHVVCGDVAAGFEASMATAG